MSARWRPTDLDAINALASPPASSSQSLQASPPPQAGAMEDPRASLNKMTVGGGEIRVKIGREMLVESLHHRLTASWGHRRIFPKSYAKARRIDLLPFRLG